MLARASGRACARRPRGVRARVALPGECVEVEIIRQAASATARGRVVTRAGRPPARAGSRTAPCYGRCGGCHARHMTVCRDADMPSSASSVYDRARRASAGLPSRAPLVRETLGCAQPDRLLATRPNIPSSHGKHRACLWLLRAAQSRAGSAARGRVRFIQREDSARSRSAVLNWLRQNSVPASLS